MQQVQSPGFVAARQAARLLTTLCLVLADLVAAVGVTLFSIYLREAVLPGLLGIAPFSPVRTYLSLWPILILLLVLRAVYGLYPGYGVNPAEELRRQTLSSALLLFFVLAGGALFQFSSDYSRLVLGISGGLLIIVLPFVRVAVKVLLARLETYGEAVHIVGDTLRSSELQAILSKKRLLGLRVVGKSESAPSETRADICLLIPDKLGPEQLTRLLDQLNKHFKRVWLVPNLLDVASVWVTPRDIEGHLALELQNNLLGTRNRFVKRALDLTLILLALPLIIPVLLTVALWVRLDAPGPVLFKQTRVGKNGEAFTIWKFRTMHENAQAQLEAHLSADPQARAEWLETRKLRRDPRLTRAGRVLRRTSLDELPQLWNVFGGEMSLVGPRPVVEGELDWYGDKAHLYTQVLPGLTGLFQVSGRNELSYAERARLDAYYVRNWSLWLDLVILSQTVVTVVSGRGAY